MGCGLLIYEYLHSFACHQNREHSYDVRILVSDYHARVSDPPSVYLSLSAVVYVLILPLTD